jgi:hypothetical protein
MQYNVFRGLEGYNETYPSSPRDFIHALLCPCEENAMYHKLECISGKRNVCGNLALLQPPSVSIVTCLDVLK